MTAKQSLKYQLRAAQCSQLPAAQGGLGSARLMTIPEIPAK
jgi:hypothetical protein